MKKKLIKMLLLSTGIYALTSCEALKDTFGIPNRTPVISSFDYSPKSGISRDDLITFTVVATDPEGKALQYSWTSSRGTLSANAGSTVSWKPAKQDNTFEAGLANVSVIVSDGIMTNTASVNIFVGQEGIKSVEPVKSSSPSPSVSHFETPKPSLSPSISATPAPSVSATPTPSASPTPTPLPSISPTSSPQPSPTHSGDVRKELNK